MISAFADLHLHSHYSDGSYSPAELAGKAERLGLSAIALTDHDTLDGLEEMSAAAARHGLDLIAGIELSVTVKGHEVHLLGYDFDPTHRGLNERLRQFRVDRTDRAVQMARRLSGAGLPITAEAILEKAGEGVPGRPHAAAVLIDAGVVESYNDAFRKYLRPGKPGYVARPPFTAGEAISLIHTAGGVAVLAHPGHWTTEWTIKLMIRDGLDGIEVVHPSHDLSLQSYYGRLARDYGLLETGGSDYHGFRSYDEDNFGSFVVPLAQVHRLRARTARSRA